MDRSVFQNVDLDTQGSLHDLEFSGHLRETQKYKFEKHRNTNLVDQQGCEGFLSEKSLNLRMKTSSFQENAKKFHICKDDRGVALL